MLNAISVADLFLMKATYAWLPLLINFQLLHLFVGVFFALVQVYVHFVNECFSRFLAVKVCVFLQIRECLLIRQD